MSNQIPIWIINLERSKERRKHMEKLMNKYNLKHEFIEAVDGTKLNKEELKKYLSPWRSLLTTGYLLSKSELGCALSHLKCWKKMQKENIEKVIIMEDDALFNEKFVQLLEHVDRFPKNWEFINLATHQQIMFYTNERFFDIYTFIKFVDIHLSNVTYILNAKGAQKLIAHRIPVITIADFYTGHDLRTGVISYGINPNIVVTKDPTHAYTTMPDRNEKLNILYFLLLKFRNICFIFFRINYFNYVRRIKKIMKKNKREISEL